MNDGAEGASVVSALALARGDHASYGSRDGGSTLDILLDGPRVVADVDGSRVDALLLHRWLNHTEGLRYEEVDALDPTTGGTLWTLRRCAFFSEEGACEQLDALTATTRGLPGAYSAVWLQTVAARPDLKDDLRQEGECSRLLGGIHPVHARSLFTFVPLAYAEGLPALFCPTSSFPVEFRTHQGEEFVLEAFRRGNGLPLTFDRTSPRLLPPGLEGKQAWDGHSPPQPEPPGPFGWSEALRWLDGHSSEFQDFVASHPEYYLHSTSLTDEERLDSDIGILQPVVAQRVLYRVLAIQAPDGAAKSFTLRKSTDSSGSSISQIESRSLRGNATLVPEMMPSHHVSPADATDAFVQRVGGVWEDTHVLTSFTDGRNPTVSAETFFAYRILVRPPSVSQDELTYVSYMAIVRSDTGQMLFGLVPPGHLG